MKELLPVLSVLLGVSGLGSAQPIEVIAPPSTTWAAESIDSSIETSSLREFLTSAEALTSKALNRRVAVVYEGNNHPDGFTASEMATESEGTPSNPPIQYRFDSRYAEAHLETGSRKSLGEVFELAQATYNVKISTKGDGSILLATDPDEGRTGNAMDIYLDPLQAAKGMTYLEAKTLLQKQYGLSMPGDDLSESNTYFLCHCDDTVVWTGTEEAVKVRDLVLRIISMADTARGEAGRRPVIFNIRETGESFQYGDSEYKKWMVGGF